MWTSDGHSPSDRLGSAIAAIIVQGAFAALFLWGMGNDARQALVEPLKLIHILPPKPERQTVTTDPPPRAASQSPKERFTPREEGGSSPPNLRSQATLIVAPRPIVPLPVRTPVVVAPVPGTGHAPSQGAAPVPGPGTGSGGFGDGSGSGVGGGGPGGGGYGEWEPPRLIRGRLRDSDFPAGLGEAGVQGTVGVIFTVRADGKVSDCQIRRSSGSSILDETTCRLIERRFVYEPSRDPDGRPVQSRVVENHSWIVEDDPEQPEPVRRRRRIF